MKKMLPIVVVALVVGLGAGKMLLGGKAAPAAAEAGATTTTTEAPGETIAVDPVTLNLADGRFLKVGLAFEVVKDEEGGGGGHGGAEEVDVKAEFAPALDAAIDVLGGRTFAQLVEATGRAEAKEELLHHLEEAYHGEIREVYFTQFVMQ